jgi:plasmid stabilization system protein ParE
MHVEIATEQGSDLHHAIEQYAEDNDLSSAAAYATLLEDGLAANVAEQPTTAEADQDATGQSDDASSSHS